MIKVNHETLGHLGACWEGAPKIYQSPSTWMSIFYFQLNQIFLQTSLSVEQNCIRSCVCPHWLPIICLWVVPIDGFSNADTELSLSTEGPLMLCSSRSF